MIEEGTLKRWLNIARELAQKHPGTPEIGMLEQEIAATLEECQ